MAILSRFSKSVENASCKQLFHPWTSSCTLGFADFAFAMIRGTSIYFTVGFLGNYLKKLAMKRDGFDGIAVDRQVLLEQLKIYLTHVFFGTFQGTIALFFGCFFRQLFGKFYRSTMILIPGMIGGISYVSALDYSERLFYASFYTNLVLSLFQQRLHRSGQFRMTYNQKLCIFVLMSSAISGLLKALDKEAHRFRFLWFFNPLSHHGLKKSEMDSCYHGQTTCTRHIFQDFLKYFTTGLAFVAVKVLLKQGPLLIKNPLEFLRQLLRPSQYNLAFFLGGYALIYQATRCCAQKLKGDVTVADNVIAGGLAGCTFAFNPNKTFLNFSVITVVQILARMGIEAKIVPNWPFLTIFYAISNGFLYDAELVVGDSSNLAHYGIHLATLGRTTNAFKRICKINAI